MVMLAKQTISMIDSMVEADQGSAYRGWLGKVIGHMGDAYRTDEDGHRSHMGASLLGGECPRAIWYGFRWATKSAFPGRIIRLFNRGHLEEARFIAMLLMIGCQVYQQDGEGKQYRISFANGHAGGSGDGIIVGLPDLPAGMPALGEFKTHSSKSFKELVDKGMREAKFEHFVQMNLYMYKMGLGVGLYLAVNKDNDELYGEIVTLDEQIAATFVQRGEKLVVMQEPPERLSKSPGFFKCRFCNHRPVCHLKAVPDRNCRTCVHSEPAEAGQWVCTMHPVEGPQIIDKKLQLTGCEHYSAQGHYCK